MSNSNSTPFICKCGHEVMCQGRESNLGMDDENQKAFLRDALFDEK